MKATVVPARAGMSPGWHVCHNIGVGGPRASGDEPYEMLDSHLADLWSPRERG